MFLYTDNIQGVLSIPHLYLKGSYSGQMFLFFFYFFLKNVMTEAFVQFKVLEPQSSEIKSKIIKNNQESG